MDEWRLFGTPMVTRYKFSKEDNLVEVNEVHVRLMIKKLQYVVHSRLDIAHAVGIVTKFSANPKETHMTIVKRIFRYMKGIGDYILWYKKECDFELQFYNDVD